MPMDAMAKTLQSASNSGNKKSQERLDLLVLHTNDLHSRIEPFPANHPMAGKGGIANLATLIQQHRKQHPHVLLLDCGDVFQGTPYFNLFGGAVEYQWMQNMGYHATTMGNHDFDNGIEHLANMLEKNPGVGMLNCNYQLHNTPLKDLVQPHKIIQIAHKKIVIIIAHLFTKECVQLTFRLGLLLLNLSFGCVLVVEQCIKPFVNSLDVFSRVKSRLNRVNSAFN